MRALNAARPRRTSFRQPIAHRLAFHAAPAEQSARTGIVQPDAMVGSAH